ncbi:hypothetical protein [Nocardia ninae]|nr:hypothetical protein [Nocardia ninae]
MGPLTAILIGSFTLIGGISGVLLTGFLNQRSVQQKQTDEDKRRWLTDLRQIYAKYLLLCESMLREVDAIATLMPYDDTNSISIEDAETLRSGVLEYVHKWDTELQVLLFEIQLMASPRVVDLADRMSGALLMLSDEVSESRMFVGYYPAWFQARDLLQVLRNAMRDELDLPALTESTFPRPAEWPWLPGRPPRESYRQGHTIHDAISSGDRAPEPDSTPPAVTAESESPQPVCEEQGKASGQR